MTAENDFWSRRKAKVREESDRLQHAEETAKDTQLREELEHLPDAEILEKLDLPEPESLGPGDDFSVFMARAVPQRLRTRALRKLWLTNPTLANLDQLIDYGEDYTDAALAVENIQTAYQVGKGMLKHVLETEKEDAEQAEMDAQDIDEGDPVEPVTETATIVAPQDTQLEHAEDLSETIFHASVQDEMRPGRRRMRFAFVEDEEKQKQSGPQRTK